MGTVRQLLNRVKSFNAIAAAGRAMRESQEAILDINREQLQHGINADNEPVGFYRSISYALDKNRRNPLAGYGVVDLKDTGAFYKSFKLTIVGNKWTITATDVKAISLEAKYSPKIYGFTEENKMRVWEAFKADFINEFKKHTGL